MNKNNIFLSVFLAFVFGVAFSYGLVFAVPIINIESNFSLSDNIFLNSEKLSSNKLIIKTSEKPDIFKFEGDCSPSVILESSNGETHVFDVKIQDKSCNKKTVDVLVKAPYKTLKHSFKIIKEYDLYSKFLDYSTADLQNSFEEVKKTVSNLENSILETGEQRVKNERKIEELKYFEEFFGNILEKRKQKFLFPVKGGKVPVTETKVPNSPRPYRNTYTDGIHHGWDLNAPKGSTIVSLDDGIVIRVVKGFTPSEFGKLKRDGEITDKDKTINLDILRGNQVWIKTMKGDVAFYSHLEEIFPEIKEGMILKRGQPVGTVGATGVPEEGYSDFHLHLSLQSNPLDTARAGTYTYLDIMGWPWSFKGQSASYTLEHYHDIFEKLD
ncbi:M23 family metallopeptidase [Candidatus Gracilibacteria bacterium]|nr:MAG: M23 family metallopeptidase [Candidatus Gracilibacteria bacterium]